MPAVPAATLAVVGTKSVAANVAGQAVLAGTVNAGASTVGAMYGNVTTNILRTCGDGSSLYDAIADPVTDLQQYKLNLLYGGAMGSASQGIGMFSEHVKILSNSAAHDPLLDRVGSEGLDWASDPVKFEAVRTLLLHESSMMSRTDYAFAMFSQAASVFMNEDFLMARHQAR